VRRGEQPEPHRSVRPDRTAKTAEDRPLQGKAGRGVELGRGRTKKKKQVPRYARNESSQAMRQVVGIAFVAGWGREGRGSRGCR
jgi:hypothetical protein